MKYRYILLLVVIFSIPTSAQQEPPFVLLNQFDLMVTSNDPGEGRYSRYFTLLDPKSSIPNNADEVRMEVYLSDQTMATGVEILLISEGINQNDTHPVKSTKQQHSVVIDPLMGLTNITLWVHWYSLLEDTSCTGCDFQYSSSVQVRFFTAEQNWQSSLRSSGSISHRDRAVTLEDFQSLSIEAPGVKVGTANPTASYSPNPDTTMTAVETTTVYQTVETTATDQTTVLQRLPISITFMVLGIIAIRRLKNT